MSSSTHRIRLPAPMVPRDQISIWSILKNCIGKELSKITMPVVFNEPLTMLQRSCESIQYTHLLKMADQSEDPVERMEYICAFVIAGLSSNCHRIIKPFNPLLYETYEIDHQLDDGSIVKGVAQQVSHHPPITAAHYESDYFVSSGSVNPKIKFWGRSVEIQPDGHCRIYLKSRKETYLFKSVTCSVHNIIVGKLWFEHCGPLDIKCIETNIQANLIFRQAGWFSNDLHRFDGTIVLGDDKKMLRFVYGKWSDYVKSVDYSEYEKYIRENQKKPSKVPELPIDLPNSKTIWKLDSHYLKEYYNYTLYTMRMNELTEEMAKQLPRTDSRFRSDVRKLEEGDLDGAASEKHRLEEKQREARARDVRFKNPSSDFLWFEFTNVPPSKEKFWTYKGGYWENKLDTEKFPDLF